jgi:hypothetical protein
MVYHAAVTRKRKPRGEDRYIGSQSAGYWPDPRRGPWEIIVHWAEIRGWLEPIGLELRSFNAAELRKTGLVSPALPRGTLDPVTTGLLRQIPWRQKFDESLRFLQGQQVLLSMAQAIGTPAQSTQKHAREIAPALLREQARGRGRPPDVDYRKVADVYRMGGSKATEAVAEHFKVSRSTAAKRVQRARALGHLGPALKGKAGQTPPRAQKSTAKRTRRKR